MGECADMANTSEETGKNLREQVYTRLRNSILEGEYHGNQQLRESELTERYGVSRSPVREALKQLVGDGLAYNIPNRGVFVRQITEADVESIFDIRILVERYALQKMIVNLGACGFEVGHIAVKLCGVALTDGFGQPCVEVGERHEDDQTPDGAEEVEEQVAHGGALGGHVAAQRGEDRRDCRADVAAEDECAGKVEGNPALATHY